MRNKCSKGVLTLLTRRVYEENHTTQIVVLILRPLHRLHFCNAVTVECTALKPRWFGNRSLEPTMTSGSMAFRGFSNTFSTMSNIQNGQYEDGYSESLLPLESGSSSSSSTLKIIHLPKDTR